MHVDSIENPKRTVDALLCGNLIVVRRRTSSAFQLLPKQEQLDILLKYPDNFNSQSVGLLARFRQRNRDLQAQIVNNSIQKFLQRNTTSVIDRRLQKPRYPFPIYVSNG